MGSRPEARAGSGSIVWAAGWVASGAMGSSAESRLAESRVETCEFREFRAVHYDFLKPPHHQLHCCACGRTGRSGDAEERREDVVLFLFALWPTWNASEEESATRNQGGGGPDITLGQEHRHLLNFVSPPAIVRIVRSTYVHMFALQCLFRGGHLVSSPLSPPRNALTVKRHVPCLGGWWWCPARLCLARTSNSLVDGEPHYYSPTLG